MEALEAGAHAFPSYQVMSGKVFIDFKAQPDFYAFDCEHRHFDQTIERIMAAQSGYMQR